LSVFDYLSFSFPSHLPKYSYKDPENSFCHLLYIQHSNQTFVNGKMLCTIRIHIFQVDNIERRNTFSDEHGFPGHITFPDNIPRNYLNSPLNCTNPNEEKHTFSAHPAEKYFLNAQHRKLWQKKLFTKNKNKRLVLLYFTLIYGKMS
jgi:hypothetical protein